MVEVYKTNILAEWTAREMILSLKEHFPGYQIHVDLQDCDKVLRVESDSGPVNHEKLLEVAHSHDVEITKM